MSIINDALQKVEKEKQILKKINQLKTSTKKYVFKRWLVWGASGLFCLLGIIWAVDYFKPVQRMDLVQEAAVPREINSGVFQLRSIGLDTRSSSSDFHLSGIVYDQKRPLAIINDRIVVEGALIDSARLLEIQPDYVRLSLEGKEIRLKVE